MNAEEMKDDDDTKPNGPRTRSKSRNINTTTNNTTTPNGLKRRRSFRPSFLRVNSRIPHSPTQRARNYNHVSDAVASQFQEIMQKSRDNTPLGVIGLTNLGNTCFLNSSIQCLSATIPLTDYFLGYDYRSEINHDNFLGTGGKLVTAYAALMKDLWLGRQSTVSPVAFKAQLEQFAPQFKGYHQHDAQELLSFLLDGIHEDLNRIKKKPYIEDKDCDGTNDEQDAIEAWKNYLCRDKSLIVDIFQGQLRSEVQCLKCRHKNIRFEPFMYLSLPISAHCRSLEDCLRLYLAKETLSGENQWYCSQCQKHRDATKKTDLWILPPILIVHLKRFKFKENGRMGSKNEAPIAYPVRNWDLSRHVLSQGSEYPLFDLYALSNHVGNLGSGHYTAYALNRFSEQWYEFNDTRCHELEERAFRRNQSSAYVLFYNRSARKGAPVIRRQSVSRPDLWPHTQVQDRQFREFTRQSRKWPPAPPLSETNSET
ncbi:ubiquitin carboxyl-terminal hydrolase 8 [Fistulifera solaris]|uniref:Ubiquitin carboxyl-terminal hydrolase n=1 Tax=Fistulifera solaris TaxID=1519565 RepID=A0A1Z5JUW1_FISSO|nr:ubiquitin carboxyl-terminal hydrolase 8 [Fistulifera solaris]|eukprot:GAX17834.1 ubiquitin carboxyl-terminal hydrolase 8 [Fistulifera solaris]